MIGSSARIGAETVFRDMHERLAAGGLDTPDLDASLLFQHVTGLTLLDRIRDPALEIGAAENVRIGEFVERRLAGEPVHRIIGTREFYGLPLALNEATLIPRPDTETLVDLVLPFARDTVSNKGSCRILDLGTGTGAIALALVANTPGAVATGTDISERALEAARANASRNDLADRFTAVLSDWFANVSGHYDLIVSNPPYIESSDIAGLDPEVRDHDPGIALDGGFDGLDAYGIIAANAHRHLSENGAIAVEHGFNQKSSVTALFEAAGYEKAAERMDYSGHDRAIFFIKP